MCVLIISTPSHFIDYKTLHAILSARRIRAFVSLCTLLSAMAKGRSKSAAAPTIKTAIGTAALLVSGASAKGLLKMKSEAGEDEKEKEVVVASFHLSGKRGLNNDDPPANSTVTEKVIAETAPLQMSDDPPPNLTVAEKVIAETAPFQLVHHQRREKEEKKEKKSKKEKKEKKSKEESKATGDGTS